MATITNRDIADTIHKLMVAGKRMPMESGGSVTEATKNLEDMIAMWSSLFGNVGVERWKSAEQIALTLPKAEGLNVNIVSPGLMAHAIDLAEKQYIEQQQQKAAEYKNITPNIVVDSYDKYVSKYLGEWTIKKRKKNIMFLDLMPRVQAVIDYADKIGVKCLEPMEGCHGDAYKNYLLLQTFLSDHHYCKTQCDKARCYMGCKQPKLYVNDGQLRIELVGCGK